MDWVDDLERGWKREYPGVDVTALPPLVRLARLAVLIETLQRETVAPFDLTPADYTVLAALRRVGPPYEASPSRLYNVLQRSSGGMTKMLKRLEALGLVHRAADPNDGRGSLVALTRRGLELQERVFHALLARTQALLEPVPARRRKEIDGALRTLLEVLEPSVGRDGA